MSTLLQVLSRIASYSYREETLDGRLHYVVPMVMLVEGVHTGSAGPSLYTAAEIADFYNAWNGVPVTVSHPVDRDGAPISANAPVVIEHQAIGRVFNTAFDESENKLRAEAWIDVQKADQVDPAILAAIRSGSPMEVSTGLFSDSDSTPGEWKGEHYDRVVRGIRPDHLALLPNEIGACSIKDGCGLRANADNQEGTMTVKAPAAAPAPAANAEPPATGELFPAPENLMQTLKALKDSGFAWTVNADISHDSIRGKLQTIVNDFDNAQWLNWVRSVFDNYFIYEARGHNPATGGYSYHLYKRDYTMNDTGVVTLGETVTEVIEETVYTPVPEMAANKGKEKETMNKAKVDALIANERTRFVECDRKFLEGLSEEQLVKLEPMDPPAAAPAPVANAQPAKPECKTVADVVANAPDEFKPFLNSAVARETAAKTSLVNGLLANARNKFTKEQLEAKPTSELEQLAELANVPVDYSGRGGGESQPTANKVTPLELPKSNETKAA